MWVEISRFENGFGKKTHTIIICGPQKKEVSNVLGSMPSSFLILSSKVTTCCMQTWSTECALKQCSVQASHSSISFLSASPVLMERDWAPRQIRVSAAVTVHYLCCNQSVQFRARPSIFWNLTPGSLVLGEPRCQVTFDRVSPGFLFEHWTACPSHLRRKVISRFNVDSISINHRMISTFSYKGRYRWHIFFPCVVCA